MLDAEMAPDPQLMMSMRAVGYTIETAVADIIDNSIAAMASTIDIKFGAFPNAHIAILDNGAGMDNQDLLEAMRFAGKGAESKRSEHDLGRFGLGLKTASLSQARTLTVASKQGSQVAAARWDLDHVLQTGRWALQVLNDREIAELPYYNDLLKNVTGTVVLWTDLDQLHAADSQVERVLDEQMLLVREHLSLVFHRFTGSVTAPLNGRLSIQINGAPVPTVDPFLSSHRGTRQGTPQSIKVRAATVQLQPYTLPHVNRMTSADKATAQISGLLRDSQGFYIYRAGRLVIWGTWFRIMPKNELGKLARVRVDIPNTLDHLWALDIKKSAATPPPEVRLQLKRLAARMVTPSRSVHEYRGRPDKTADKIQRMWTLIDNRGCFRYEVNRDHPAIAALAEAAGPMLLSQVDEVLRMIESSFPVADAYNRMSSDMSHSAKAVDQTELADLVRVFHGQLGGDYVVLAQKLALVEPFDSLPDLENFVRSAINE